MRDRSDIEEAEASIPADWQVKSLREKVFCNDYLPLQILQIGYAIIWG